MNIEEQVLTIEQAKHLQELGLDMSDAALCWNRQTRTWDNKEPSEWRKKWSVVFNKPLAVMNFENYESIPTYTLQEVLDKLPTVINIDNRDYRLMYDRYYEVIFYNSRDRGYAKAIQNEMLKAAYDMLCWVIENGYLEESK